MYLRLFTDKLINYYHKYFSELIVPFSRSPFFPFSNLDFVYILTYKPMNNEIYRDK